MLLPTAAGAVHQLRGGRRRHHPRSQGGVLWAPRGHRSHLQGGRTDFRKVTAIIRTELLEAVEQRLPRAGAKGVTVTHVKGYGEYADFFSHDWQVRHVRLEIFTEGAKVQRIVEAIMEAASTGGPGDGIIAVLPVETMYRVSTRRLVTSGEL